MAQKNNSLEFQAKRPKQNCEKLWRNSYYLRIEKQYAGVFTRTGLKIGLAKITDEKIP